MSIEPLQGPDVTLCCHSRVRVLPGLPPEQEVFGALERHELGHRSVGIDPLPLVRQLELRFPRAFEAMEICGIHPSKRHRLTDPYSGKDIEESFANIGYHSVAVAECAQRIASACLDMALLGAQDVDHVVERALIHDLLKPFEVLHVRHQVEGSGGRRAMFDRHAACSVVSQLGVNSSMADYLCAAGSETGGVNVGSILEISGGVLCLRSGLLVSKIVRLADTMTFTPRGEPGTVPRSEFLTPWARLVASESAVRYPQSLRHGFASLEDGSIILIDDIQSPPANALVLGHMLFLETLAANWVCDELRESLGLGVGWPAEQLVMALAQGRKAEESAVS